MFKTMGWPEILLILVIVLLVFGVGRISKIAGELGAGIKAFKDGISGDKKENQEDSDNPDVEEEEQK